MGLACVCAVCLCVLVSSARLSDVEPVFTLDSESGFSAAKKAGAVAARPVKEPKLQPGRVGGNALLSGPATGYLDFPAEGVVNATQGTIEMWVSPVDWNANERAFHVFFAANAADGKGSLFLYKYFENYKHLWMYSRSDDQGSPSIKGMDITHWQVGIREWHHVAATWSGEGVMLYLDGKPAAARKSGANLPSRISGTFRIGDDEWEEAAKTVNALRTSSTLLDDILIYDKELTPAQIDSHFLGNFNASSALVAEQAQISHSIDIEHTRLSIEVKLNAPDYDDSRLQVVMRMTPAAAQAPSEQSTLRKAREELCPVKDNATRMTVPLDSLAPESFDLTVSVSHDGTPAYQLHKIIEVPPMPWLGNSLGKERCVLPPWTPLSRQGDTIFCWGREYAFDQYGLPARIVSAGENVLAAPVRLAAKDAAGNEISWAARRRSLMDLLSDVAMCQWQGGGFSFSSVDDVAASGAGSIQGASARGAISFTTAMNIEYDGLLLLDLALDDKEATADGQPLEELSVEIPLRSEHALYRHRNWMSGLLPAGKENGVVESWPFSPPFIWLGDDDRGLFWFCENSAMWPNASNGDAIQVLRQGDQVVLRLNLLKKGQKLPANWRWQCGVQATPVKPMTTRRRQIDLISGKAGVQHRIVWPTPGTMPLYGYPEAKEPEFTEYARKTNMALIPYCCLSAMSTKAPEWPLFAAYRTTLDWGSSPDVASVGGGFVVVDPKAPGYADFMTWKNHEFVAKYKLAGLYHDLVSPFNYSRSPEIADYAFLAQRDLYRRVYGMLKKCNPQSFSIAHMSGSVLTPALAYVDAYLDGEQFRGRVKKSYLDVLPLPYFRCEFSGRAFGIEPIFLPEIENDIKAADPGRFNQLTREAIMLCLLHDVTSWAWACDQLLFRKAFDTLAAFGYADAEFIRYDAPQAPLVDLPNDVLASAYRRQDGSLLLLVCNLGNEAKTWKSRMLEHRLGITPASAVSLNENDRAAPLVDGEIEVSLKAHDFAMIMLSKDMKANSKPR